jgi:uncharacterized membrane protein YkgB
MKFTSYEAQAIEPLVSNPTWLGCIRYRACGLFSNSLGVLEILIGIRIAARPISAATGLSHRELAGCGGVLYDSELHDHDVTGLGGEHGRFPG